MKKILSVAAISSFLFASGNFIMPYIGYIDYSNESIKDGGVTGGVYFSKYLKNSKIEVDLEHTFIRYKSYVSFANDNNINPFSLSYNPNNYHQTDFTTIFNFYGNDMNFKIGDHIIFIDQDGNNDDFDNIFIIGMDYFKYLKYNLGVDFYYGSFDGFNVKQFSPYAGINLGNYYSEYGSFYAKVQLNYIKLSDDEITGRKNYLNYDLSLSNYIKNWTTTLRASFAKSAYKVSNGGFVVYNLGDEYKNSFGIDVNYKIDSYSSVTAGFTYSKFKEIFNANSAVYLLSYSRAF